MNEKSKKYLYFKNDKSLIGGKIPKESDLETFEQWKKRTRKKILELIIISSTILIIIYTILLTTGIFLEAELKEKIFGIISLLIFTYAEYVLIKRYFNAKTWKMECCNYGKVIDKYTMPRGNSRDYYIVANVNSNDIKIKSKSYEYRLLDINDEIVVFSIEGNNKVYACKKYNKTIN